MRFVALNIRSVFCASTTEERKKDPSAGPGGAFASDRIGRASGVRPCHVMGAAFAVSWRTMPMEKSTTIGNGHPINWIGCRLRFMTSSKFVSASAHSFIHSFIMRMSFCGGWRCCPRRCAEDRSSLCTLCVLALLLFPSARIPCNRTPTAASCQVQLARLKCNLLDSSTLQQLHAVQSNGGSGPGLPHTRTHTKRRSSSPKQQSEFVDVSLETNAGGKQHVK